MVMDCMKGLLNLEESMEWANIDIKMELFMMVIGIIIKNRALASIYGRMHESIQVNGKRIRWMVLVCMNGQMGENIWVSTL